MEQVRKIVSIENKANYTWYLSECRKKNELVLYHGGFFSPLKGRWFKLLAETANAEVLHWGDIDLGGFRIFCRLKEQIFSDIRPYRMDRETLAANRDS